MRTLFRLLITAVLTAAVLAAVILLRLPVQTLQIATVPLINIAASAGACSLFLVRCIALRLPLFRRNAPTVWPPGAGSADRCRAVSGLCSTGFFPAPPTGESPGQLPTPNMPTPARVCSPCARQGFMKKSVNPTAVPCRL